MSADSTWLILMFSALVLIGGMYGLAASGHFPAEHRNPKLAGFRGSAALFGSMALVACSCMAGAAIVVATVPWYAIVIGAGAGVLMAPIVLRLSSDKFVDGFAGLLALCAIAVAIALFMIFLAVR